MSSVSTDAPRRVSSGLRGWVKASLPRTLFGRALLILALPLIGLQVITSFVFFDRHWETMTRRAASALAGEIATIVDLLNNDTGSGNLGRVADLAFRNMDLRVRFLRGQHLDGAGPRDADDTISDQLLIRALEERLYRPFKIDTDTLDRDIAIHVDLPDGILEVVTTRKRLTGALSHLVILWMVGSSLVLLAIAVVFLRNQIRPIRRLAIAADGLGKGRDVPTLKLEGAMEVRQATAAFNLMRERLQRQLTQRTEMLAGVSHDLRTPLTRMKLQLALLGDSPEIVDLGQDVGEMERMVEAYLAFARGDGGERAVPSDIAHLVAEAVEGARRGGRDVELSLPGPLPAPVRPNALKRCLGNLISNALRHGKHVAVSASRHDGAIEVTVDDDGPGIPEAERETVFKPFVRLDAARSPATGGVGLGLTIARDIVRGHGGDIVLGRSPLGGLRALVRLPL
jgi:two-component system osmolarity sensor histidine kinase EnvZ